MPWLLVSKPPSVDIAPLPRNFGAAATGHPSFTGDRLAEILQVGKHLLMRFDSGRTVHSHLRMRGSWRVH